MTCTAASLRREVLRLYKDILKVGRSWEAAERIETRVERDYIKEEARLLFRHNAGLTDEAAIRERLAEGETRVTMALHYGNPYPRPVNIPKYSFSKREGKKFGKAVQKINDMSRPVYLKSMDEVVRKRDDVQ